MKKNSIMNTCPACKGESATPYFAIESLPLLLFPVHEKERNIIKREKISSFICQDCHHIFTIPLSKENANLIYGEYYKHYPYDNLESMNIYYRKPFELFFESFFTDYKMQDQKKLDLLEIGCSSGDQLGFFEKYGFNCYGIDPSPLIDASDERIISGFYQDYNFKKKFDIIIARFVFEHVNYPTELLQKISRDLTDNGIVLLQVPNVTEFIQNEIPNFLAHEHSQYFNPESLIRSAETNGFKVKNIHYKNSQSIIVSLSKNAGNQCVVDSIGEGDLFEEYLRKRNELGKILSDFIQTRQGPLCFYGSGLMVSWILYDLNLDTLRQMPGIIFDDNAMLENKYMPCSEFKIQRYSKEKAASYTSILLTLNPVYHTTVIQKLHHDDYKGEIYLVNKEGFQKVI